MIPPDNLFVTHEVEMITLAIALGALLYFGHYWTVFFIVAWDVVMYLTVTRHLQP